MKDKILLNTVVSEMAASAADVPFSDKVDAKKLTDGDSDPVFVTVEVASAGVSKNKNRYTSKVLHSIAKQVNDTLPDGYLGHLDDKERPTKYPEPQTMWVGAVVRNIDGVERLFAKGYVYADSKIKSLLKKAVAAGKTMAVSIYGGAERKFDKVAQVYDIMDFELESIDWARPGSQGLNPKYLPAITQETVVDMDKQLKEVTLEDLKKFRPELVDELKEEFKKETPEANPQPNTNPTPENTEKTGEMADVRKVLGLDETASVKETVSEMVESNKKVVSEMKELLGEHISNEVGKEVKNKAVVAVVKEMVMKEVSAWNKDTVDKAIQTVLQSKVTKDLISEMTKETPINPVDDNRSVATSGTSKFIKK